MQKDEENIDVLLIYPQLGSWDDVVRDIPLSLIYAATDSVKRGFNVQIIDLRFHGSDWPEEVDRHFKNGSPLVGLSVMTGNPIRNALNVSSHVKQKYGALVVWGGAHPTIMPEQTLENPYIDFVIRDWGSRSLADLLDYLINKNVKKAYASKLR